MQAQVINEYEKQANDFLAAHGLEFRVVLVGDDCPPFCEDARADRDMDKLNTFPRRTHVHGKHYRCTFSGQGRGHLGVDFWNSYQDEAINWAIRHRFEYRYKEHYEMEKAALRVGRKIQTPTAYDVLACITKSDPGTFENFCGDFGCDMDSRRAEEVYHSVVREWQKTRKFFTSAELEELQAIN